ncbi:MULTISPECIES: hypothetical protein [unclassified Streptomyces]|uniref:hypothetical protein n=1 Tax=unclassified Streptomyces TaxID=2593676 RepID=UPI0029A96AC3|nr:MULTISPECIES: hypothetical protein [unclassified Streptomyces]MDX3766462.1 hypothetical protein [Streptomyces sp. AK08-01B]MDX3816281.1 hypothetical protein [Streptomyces sp. AK08-01A]
MTCHRYPDVFGLPPLTGGAQEEGDLAVPDDHAAFMDRDLSEVDSSTCGSTASTLGPISEDGSVGYLTVPWSIGGIGRLIAIDGQHRILGVHLEKKRITDEVSRIDREMHRANEAKEPKLEQDREALIGRMQRLKDEFVGIDIYVEPDGVSGQQMFVDVADNAKGISGAVRARFDTSRIANWTLSDIVTGCPPVTSPLQGTPVCAPTSTRSTSYDPAPAWSSRNCAPCTGASSWSSTRTPADPAAWTTCRRCGTCTAGSRAGRTCPRATTPICAPRAAGPAWSSCSCLPSTPLT